MLGLAALAVAVVVVLLSFGGICKRWRLWRDMEKLPGYISLPILGTTYRLIFTKREESDMEPINKFNNQAKGEQLDTTRYQILTMIAKEMPLSAATA